MSMTAGHCPKHGAWHVGHGFGRCPRCEFARPLPERPYVYELIDPRTCSPFYIGKGRNDRALAHERDVRAGRAENAEKAQRIREIIGRGDRVEIRVVSVHETDKQAFDAERVHIKALTGRAPLTNLRSGGGGAYGHATSLTVARQLAHETLTRLMSRDFAIPKLHWDALRWVIAMSAALFHDVLTRLGGKARGVVSEWVRRRRNIRPTLKFFSAAAEGKLYPQERIMLAVLRTFMQEEAVGSTA